MLQLRGFSDEEPIVRREALGTCEELPHPDVLELRQDLHCKLEKGSQPVPVRWDLSKVEIIRDPVERPRRGYRFEQTDHEPSGLFEVVGVAVGVLEDGEVGRHAVERLADQVRMLDGLERDRNTGESSELAGPHAGTVDNVVGFDVSAVGHHSGDTTSRLREPGNHHTLDHFGTTETGPLG